MSILIRRIDGRALQLINGQSRLRASLEVHGKATVTDAETHETFEVHEVQGELVLLSDGRGAAAETIAATANSKCGPEGMPFQPPATKL